MKNKLVRIMKREGISVLFLFVLMISVIVLHGWKNAPSLRKDGELSVMFYNVENLFDTIDSPLNDQEFLPEGQRRWNTYKYFRKLRNLFKVIILAGDQDGPPEIIGLCEVENETVLNHLCTKTYLSQENYKYIISDTKDSRGICTALLYDETRFSLISTNTWHPRYEDGTYMSTRGVLFVRIADETDTLDLIISHWPSRRGGVLETEPLRKQVASLISKKCDSIGLNRKIIIMGDLNTEPDSETVRESLGASLYESEAELYNMSNSKYSGVSGSYKYQANWYLYDQIIVSSSLVNSTRGYFTGKQMFKIIDSPALLSEDVSYKGFRPFSTWHGYKYSGGNSDHLPVRLDLAIR